jgi:hypothetical protein
LSFIKVGTKKLKRERKKIHFMARKTWQLKEVKIDSREISVGIPLNQVFWNVSGNAHYKSGKEDGRCKPIAKPRFISSTPKRKIDGDGLIYFSNNRDNPECWIVESKVAQADLERLLNESGVSDLDELTGTAVTTIYIEQQLVGFVSGHPYH